jgi:alpha/beta superfamily hydrolase
MLDDGELFLPGPAGRIEASLKRREGARAAALVCHPHPLYGGTMHNKVAYRAGRALHAAGLTVLRFNFRGVGASEGTFDGGRGEREDVATLIDHLARDHDEILVAGYSFGAWVGLDAGRRDARVRRLVGIGLPVALFDFAFLSEIDRPALLVQGDGDTWGEVARVPALAPARARVHVLLGTDHFFESALEEMMQAITAFAREPLASSPHPR